jgi:lysine-N-methylase
MKKKLQDTMLMPTYVSRFSCIGGDCEDTCCAGWTITLDKDSFQNYQTSFDPVLRPLISKYVKRTPESKSPGKHAVIVLRDDECRSCPFLSEKKLCLIQERSGEKALSNTCAYYPRTVHRLGDLHQMTLTLSCPEAARLALLAEDAFGFVGQEQTVNQGIILVVPPKGGLSLEAMDEVRTLMIQVLRSRDVSLSKRLKLIGSFCERVTELIEKKQVETLPELLLRMEAELDSGEAMAPLAELTELPGVQAQIAGFIFVAAKRNPNQGPHVRQVMDEVARGLGIQEGAPWDGPALIAAYEKGLERLAPALEAVPWLLEHYLLNEALREVFPWGQETPRRHFVTFIIHYLIARLMLVGRAAAREAPLSPTELAETIQVSARRYLHHETFSKQADEDLTKGGWDSLERLYAMI